MERESIRIRLIPRGPLRQGEDPRVAFWRSMAQEDNDFNSLEGKLCSEFGPALRNLLVKHLSEPLRDVDKIFIGSKLGDIDYFLIHAFERCSMKGGWQEAQALEAFARLIEQREQFLRENRGLKAVREKIAATSEIIFNTRITGYSSINLELSIGGLKKVVEVFDNDFDSFRVFLEAFVPQAYARVFDSSDAQRLDSDIQIPDSFAKAFVTTQSPAAGVPVALPAHLGSEQSPSNAHERAEWLWKLANGSLLVPVVLSLVVLYLGISMLHDIGKSQNKMMKPIFDHQMKLLEEDRRRLFKESVSALPTTIPPARQTQQ